MDTPRSTLTHHILRSQDTYPGARGEFSSLVVQIGSACKRIGAECRRAGLGAAHGNAGTTNVHGEEVQRLDAFANEAFVHAFDHTGLVAALVSEEMEKPYIPAGDGARSAEYVVCFDPLDGSSNIEVDVTVGTIFSIQRRVDPSREPEWSDLLRPGTELVAAGYALYGPASVFVLATNDGVDLFTQDPATGDFLLTEANVTIPARGPAYSINEANQRRWEEPTTRLVEALRAGEVGEIKSARYVGSLVADFHRTLYRGGLFAYPGDTKNPAGKIRLLYEAAPLSWVAEKAGGAGSTGSDRILEVVPTDVHQRTPIFLGGADDVADAERILAG